MSQLPEKCHFMPKDELERRLIVTALIAKGYRGSESRDDVEGFLRGCAGVINVGKFHPGELTHSGISAGKLRTLQDILDADAFEAFKPIEVALEGDLTAVVGKTYVEVGCRTFKHQSVLDVAAAIELVRKED